MKIAKGVRDVIAVVLVLAVVFGAGYYTAMKTVEPEEVVVEKIVEKPVDIELPGEVEKRVVTVEEVESKLMEMAELSTYSGEYTVTLGKDETRYLLDNIKVWGTTNSIEITASGIVKVGYDMNDIVVKVDDDRIYIKLPEAQLNDNYVIWDTVTCSESNNILNPIEFSQYQEIVDEIEEMGLADVESEGIYQNASENVKKIMNGFLSEFKDYEIVCSSGATPKEIPPFKVFKNWMTADDVLSGKKYPGRNIVVLGGGSVGCETADYLAPLINDLFPMNRKITLLEMTNNLMPGEGGAAKSRLTQRLMQKGVRIELNAQVTNVDEESITYVKEGVEHKITEADTLIFAVGYAPKKVEVEAENVHYIGDCEKVGTLKDAITNAHEIAKNI